MISSMLPAARNNGKGMGCEPTPPAACNEDSCCRTYCMGPDNYAVNAPVNPVTCNGDWVLNIQGFYWNAHQEGLDYAITNDVLADAWHTDATYVDAESKTPDFDWDFGFKFGIGYDTTCDGWDFGATWTWYKGKANDHIEAEQDDNDVIIALLSNHPTEFLLSLATDVKSHWELDLNLVDLELGRKFWSGKRLALRPFIGFRYASIEQDYDVEYKGGDFTPLNDKVKMDNDFTGFGIRAGLNSVWNLGCGWGIYGNLALSSVYGRFKVEIEEEARESQSPYDKTKYTDYKRHFRANRLMTDLAIGVQWSALFCECQYGFTIALGWEQHIFLNQNQLYRLNRFELNIPFIEQLHGDLDTQGWTLSVTFDF